MTKNQFTRFYHYKLFRRSKSGPVLLGLILFLFLPGLLLAQTPLPTFSKTFTPDNIGPGSTTTLVFNIGNPTGSPVTDLAFTDDLPAGLTIATPNRLSTTCGAAVSAPAGGTTLTFDLDRMGLGSNCQVRVDVTGTAAGMYTNTSGVLTSSAGNSGTATDDLTIDAGRPGISMSIAPSAIAIGTNSTVTIILDNTANPAFAGSLSFSVVLPSGLSLAFPSNLSTDCGQATLNGNGQEVSFSYNAFPGTIAAGATCMVSFDVTGQVAGTYELATTELLENSQSCGFASAGLTVTREWLVMNFIDDPVSPGSPVSIEYTITNFDRGSTISNIAFTHDLDDALSGMLVNTFSTGTCGGSLSGTDIINYSGGSLAPESSCSFIVTADVPAGAATGAYPSTTGAITFDLGGQPTTKNTATDNLVVQTGPTLTKTFLDDLLTPGDIAEMEFTIQNSNPTSAMTDIQFTDPISNFLEGVIPVNLTSDFCGTGSQMNFSNSFGEVILFINGANLAAGGSCTFTVQLQLPSTSIGDVIPGTYTNTTSTVTALVGSDPVAGLPASDDLTLVTAPSLRKTYNQAYVAPGETLVLEFELTQLQNAGGSATNIAFTDDLDAALSGMVFNSVLSNDCGDSEVDGASTGQLSFTGNTLSLAPGTSCSFIVEVSVPGSATPGEYINTTSEITADVMGESTTNSSAKGTFKIPGLALTKFFVEEAAQPGSTVAIAYTLSDLSGVGQSDLTFSDDLDLTIDNLGINGSFPMSDVCGTGSQLSLSGSTLTLNGATLGASGDCTFNISATLPANLPLGEYYTNIPFEVFQSGVGVVPTANTVNSILVTEVPDNLTLSKAFLGDQINPNDEVDLQFDMGFVGSQTATGIQFTDDLGSIITGLMATQVVSNTCSGVIGLGSTISYNNGSLNSGASCSFTVKVKIPADADGGTYTNVTSTITADNGITGNAATVDFTVLAEDRDLPLADAGEDQTVECNGSPTDIQLDGSGSTYESPAIDISWKENGMTISTGDLNPIVQLGTGTHIIVLSITDAQGTGTDDVTIVIEDTQDPVIMCPLDQTLSLDANCEASLPDLTGSATVSDACSPTGIMVTQSPASGTTLGMGITTVTLTAKDVAGNMATCTVDVTVVDDTDPVIVCPANIVVSNDAGICSAVVNYSAPVGTDNCPGVSTMATQGLGSGSAFPIGVTTETYITTDAAGNTASCSFTVTVNDTEDPVISCPADIDVSNDAGNCSAVINYMTPVGTDNCPGASTALTAGLASGAAFPGGITLVTFTVTDASDNSASCSFTVEVFAPLSVEIDGGGSYDFGCECVTLTALADGDCDPYSYLWSTTETTDFIEVCPSVSTTYTVTVTDSEGTTATATATVTKPDPVHQFDRYVVLGLSSTLVTVGSNNQVISGAIGNQHINGGINLKKNNVINDWIAANNVNSQNDNVINTLYYDNTLISGNNDQIGTIIDDLDLPLTTLPNTPGCLFNGSDVVVNGNQTVELMPGEIGALNVKKNGRVTFNPGIYCIKSINVAGDCYFGVVAGGDPSDVIILVNQEVNFGSKDTVKLNILAASNAINIGASGVYAGSFVGSIISIGSGNQLTLDPYCWTTGGGSPRVVEVSSEVNETKQDQSDLRPYPNPFKEVLTLDLDLYETGLSRVHFFSILGNQVISTKEIDISETGKYRVSFEELSIPEGLYIIQLTLPSGRKISRKVIH